ncbi:MAG: HypC/HybG/HupF family hydrogenase formation chaperone [Chloroflexota bacterium]|nr:HypC/HybG/HupF family hydrogenase formation chaperone [Chloroflexota bacterium]
MCQAIPRRVLQVADRRAEVLYDGSPTWVAAHGIPDLKVGEYLVVYAGQALERLPTDEAEEMLRFYDELERMVQEAAQ